MNEKEIQNLESKGPETVLLEIARGLHGDSGSRNRNQVEAWLRSKQVASDALAASLRDAREEETLSIAKDANRIASSALAEARRANRSRWKDRTMTMIAIIIAMIAAHKEIGSFISWLLKQIYRGP